MRFPLALEPLGVPAADPELGLLQMDRLRASVHRALHALAEELAKVLAGRHVIDVAAVRNHVAITVSLGLVDVPDTVEPAVEVVLVLAPGDAGHEVDDVSLGLPLGDPRGEPCVDPVADGDVGPELDLSIPPGMGLEAGPFELLARVGGSGRCILGACRASQDDQRQGRGDQAKAWAVLVHRVVSVSWAGAAATLWVPERRQSSRITHTSSATELGFPRPDQTVHDN